MIIVNQDRDVIINYDNVIGIQIDGNDVVLEFVNGESLILGEYKTEKRAKEVLREIVEAIAPKKPQNLTELANYKQMAKYEMPED